MPFWVRWMLCPEQYFSFSSQSRRCCLLGTHRLGRGLQCIPLALNHVSFPFFQHEEFQPPSFSSFFLTFIISSLIPLACHLFLSFGNRNNNLVLHCLKMRSQWPGQSWGWQQSSLRRVNHVWRNTIHVPCCDSVPSRHRSGLGH